jgi:DNA-binding transcriptional MerR regulator
VALTAYCEVLRGAGKLRFVNPFVWDNDQTLTALGRGACMSPKKKSAVKNKADEIFIPDKLYFRIGEVATLCRLPAYVLRFWESEFPQLKPVKSSTGQRMYRRRDVESVLRIKQLLYEQGFTIVGARQQLRAEAKPDKGQAAIPFPAQSSAEIQHIRQGLREILNLLSTRRTG